MSFAAILVLAVGLAMDATAVAAARGVAAKRVRGQDGLLVAALFGGAQALMPLLGSLLGAGLGRYVARWDHWIAFALLAGVGLKMLWEARKSDAEKADAAREDAFRLPLLVTLAIATSIDAFAVGITLPMLGAPLVLSLVTIGVTTALLSGAAVFLGRRFGAHLGSRLDVIGGLVLIALGVKIVLDHVRGG